MRRRESRLTVACLFLAFVAAPGCRAKSGPSQEAAAPSTAAPAEPAPPEAPVASPPVAGIWVDDVGDAPWQSVELIPKDEQGGRYVQKGSCPTPPCAPLAEGDYVLEGRRLSLRTDGTETDWFEVYVGGDKMEWRKDDVMLRRFRHVPPPRPPVHDPSTDRYPPECAKPAPGTPCEKMTAAGCLWSADCVLEALGREAAGAPYRCRPALAPCEGGVAQGDDGFEADCLSREGCRFLPSECFCPSARTDVAPAPGSPEADRVGRVSCACGGGPFRRCLPEVPDAADASSAAPPDA